jgi:hypothetical protein
VTSGQKDDDMTTDDKTTRPVAHQAAAIQQARRTAHEGFSIDPDTLELVLEADVDQLAAELAVARARPPRMVMFCTTDTPEAESWFSRGDR